jgi:hypothetical protein
VPTEPCALRSTQPLKVSTRDFSWGKGGRCVWLTTYHPCSAEKSIKSGALTYPEPLGPPRPVAGHLYLFFSTYNNVACNRRSKIRPLRCCWEEKLLHSGKSIGNLSPLLSSHCDSVFARESWIPTDTHSKMLVALGNGIMRIPCGRKWRRHSENRLGQV